MYIYIYTYIIHVYKCIWLFINSFCWLFTYLLVFLIIDLSIFHGTQISTFQWEDRWLWQKKKSPGFCWRKSAKFSQAFVRRWGTVQLGCLDPGMTKSWGGFPYLKGADVWSTGGMKCEVFCGCGSVICCSRRSQVVAFRISFECFLVGFCFASEKTSCWQPMVSPLDLFRFASVSWSYWFPKSQIWKRTGDVSYKTWMDGPWCCRYQACFPVHPCGSGDVMSLTSGQCQAEWNFG